MADFGPPLGQPPGPLETVTPLTREQREALRAGFRQGQREAPPPPEPVLAKQTRLIFFDRELGEAISQALTIVNAARKAEKEKPLDWNTFVVYGLVKNGLAAFEAARAEVERSSRLVLTADEVRSGGRR